MNTRPSALILSISILISACSTLTPTVESPMQRVIAISNRCVGLNAMAPREAAAATGQDPVVFERIKRGTNKSNEDICALSNDEAARIMVAERNKQRTPEAKKMKAPLAEWVRTWDMDEFGRLPTSTDFLNADAQRAALAANVRRGGRGEANATLAAGLSNTQWTELGPNNVGGRIRAIVIDPRNANRIYIGAATGGVWLTENAGQSFRPLTETLPNLSIGALAMSPANPDVLYAGTGENFAGFAGMGIFRSTDGGTTWGFLSSTSNDANVNSQAAEWGAVNRIAVSPANPNLILAATATVASRLRGAIMRSTDGGASWTRIALAAGSVLTTGPNTNFGNSTPPVPMDIQFDPTNPNNVLAGTANGHMYYSRDAGLSWTQTAPLVSQIKGRNTSARAEIAWARSRPGLVYISLDNTPDATGARGEVWKSEDSGATWTFLSTPKHLNEQGDYDNAIWVDPTNENHIIVGGLDLYQSQDGGILFNKISDWRFGTPGARQPHADHHQIVSVPNFSAGNPVVYIGNDGGLYRANNVFAVGPDSSNSAWQNLNNGLNVTQFYGGAGSRAAGGRIIGGTQDNGALELAQGQTWARTAGGDGGYAAVDPVDDTTIYGEYVFASVHRKVGGDIRQYICAGITEALQNEGSTIYCGANATEETNFISPFILDPNSRDRMYVGANSLWVTNNVRGATPTWTAIKPPIGTKADGRFINAIAVAARDPNIIYVGHSVNGSIYKTTNGLAATPTWTQVDSAQQPAATVTRLTIDPDNPNRVWVTFSGFSSSRVWVTNDGGATWTNIHNNLPNVTINDIKRHPSQANWLYVAAANGVYTSENGGQTWSATNDGPNGVRVRELFWYDQSTLIAATYGRGMFRATVAGGGPLNYSDLWWAGQSENGWGMTIQQHGNVQFNVLFVYDAVGKPIWYAMPGCTWNADFTVCNGQLFKPGSSPLNNYNAAQFVPGSAIGTVSFNYTSASTAVMQYIINGVSGQKSIQRQVFASAATTSGLQVGDMWWAGESQNGWGVSITQQSNTLFAAWYTYDPAGNTTWYTAAGTINGNTFTGNLATATSSPWLGTTYNPAQFSPTLVGTVTINFTSANAATMSYTFTSGPFAGTSQTKSIIRQVF